MPVCANTSLHSARTVLLLLFSLPAVDGEEGRTTSEGVRSNTGSAFRGILCLE